jgi:formylglycine-generating enzyme required for sulfatase activity
MLLHTLLIAATLIPIPGGSYQPLYGRPGDAPTRVASFQMDRDPVTRGDFLAFVRRNPQWRRSAVKPVFADRGSYLSGWRGDLDAGDPALFDAPITGVSWFAARAYCAEQGKRLPTVAEWEYVAAADAKSRDAARDPRFMDGLIALYMTRGARAASTALGMTNAYGVRGMHDRAWEWVEDFNSVLVSDDSRGMGERSHELYCASAAIGAADPNNFPAFLRYAIRAGATARSSMGTLGFRCAA